MVNKLSEQQVKNVEATAITTAAEQAVRLLVGGGDVSPEVLRELASICDPVAIEVFSVVECDSKNAHNKAIASHIRWGYVEQMIKDGFIENGDEYKKLFETCIFPKNELEQNELSVAIFDPGLLDLEKQWNILFVDAGIPVMNTKYNSLVNNDYCIPSPPLSAHKEYSLEQEEKDEQTYIENKSIALINPGEAKYIATVKNPLSPNDIASCMHNFLDSYNDAENTDSSYPSITLTTLNTSKNPVFCEISTLEYLNLQSVSTVSVIDFGKHLLLIRSVIDEGLRKIAEADGVDFDNLNSSRYEEFLADSFANGRIHKYLTPFEKPCCHGAVNPSGGVLTIHWSPRDGRFYLNDELPIRKLSSRISLG